MECVLWGRIRASPEPGAEVWDLGIWRADERLSSFPRWASSSPRGQGSGVGGGLELPRGGQKASGPQAGSPTMGAPTRGVGSRVLWVQECWGLGKASQVCCVQRTTETRCPSHSPQLCCVALGRWLALSGPLFPIRNLPCFLVLPSTCFQSHKVNQKSGQAGWLLWAREPGRFRDKPGRVHALWGSCPPT